VLVSRDKGDVLRVLGDGRAHGLCLAYAVQPEPRGLPDAVLCASPWLGDDDVVFAMPDTLFSPQTALADVHQHRVATGADLVLGVFPVDEPERLGPVELGVADTVLRIHDKPGPTAHRNTWGVASWSSAFTALCAQREATRQVTAAPGDPEPALGEAFEAARAEGLDVRAVYFPAGRFLDIGTARGLRAALDALATGAVILGPRAGSGV
jgi:glucose-1-phosphate thymidylyltransferase